MKLIIKDANKLIYDFIKHLGFSDKESTIISKVFLDAELSGKKSHGLGNLFWYKRAVTIVGSSGYEINTKPDPIKLLKETPSSVFVDGNKKPGYIVLSYALNLALKRIKKSYIIAGGLTNTAPSTGFVSYYAKMAVKKDLIFLCWNNSNGRDAPFGSSQRLYGTDPITIAIPSSKLPIILDMATSKITVGQLMNCMRNHHPLPAESAIDSKGNYCTDAKKVWDEGALIPFGGYKGSGLTFIGEMLAGALTASRVGYSVRGGWGTFFILINPEMFRPINDFKKDVDIGISELKNSNKRIGVREIFFPGEQSQLQYYRNLKNGFIEVESDLIDLIKKELRS